MKKQLLTTTALVAAGVLTVSGAALAGKPKLTVGGSTEQIIGIGANSDAFDAVNGQRAGFDQHSDGEVHFNGSVTLDNGIKIRTRVELESNTESNTGGETANVAHGTQGDTIDEHWMRISGSFGEVRLGSGDPAAMAMTTGYLGTWAPSVGLLMAFDSNDWVSKPGTVGAAAQLVGRVDLSSDGEHISYFTPRFAGFQAGISYVPSRDEDINNQRAVAGGNDDYEGWSLGLNFNKKFGGVGVGVAAGYMTMNESTVGRSDPEVWGIGSRIDFSGFRIAMSWVDRQEQHSTLTNVTNAGGQGQETFEIGGRYSFGPNAVSITHLNAETQASQASGRNGDEAQVTAFAYRRTLGPGVSWKVTAMFAEFNDGATGAAAGASNDGEALTTSIGIRF